LAESVAKVYSLDLTFERLLLLRERAWQRGLGNLYCLQGGDSLRLPFRDNFFDLVCFNGVLEWVACSIPGDPRWVQRELLREVRRVLKPSGQLYVGIENRFALDYFRGSRDEHVQLPYVTLLPRALANLYCLVR